MFILITCLEWVCFVLCFIKWNTFLSIQRGCRNRISRKTSSSFYASIFQIASNGKRMVPSPCNHGDGQRVRRPCASSLLSSCERGDNSISKVLWGMWMKVLFTISASTLQNVPLCMSKVYLDEKSQIILLFEHTISSFNIFIRKLFCIGDYICSVLNCEVFPRM